MAFEYIINYPCKVRKKLGRKANERMLEIRGKRIYYEQFAAIYREEDPGADIDKKTATIETMTPRGPKRKEYKLGQLKKAFEKFSKFEILCMGCPCNHALKGGYFQDALFGCYGRINYPISKQLDQLLLKASMMVVSQMINKAPEIQGGKLIQCAIHLDDIGEQMKMMRQSESNFFEGDGNEYKFEDGNGNILFDIDDLTGLLMALPIDAERGKTIYLPFFELLQGIHESDEEEESAEDRTIKQFFEYGNAIKLVVENQCELLTSM